MVTTDPSNSTCVATHVLAPDPLVASQSMLHAQLLRMTSIEDGDQLRKHLREFVMDSTGASGVTHVACDPHGHWDVENCQIDGKMPVSCEFFDQLGALARTATVHASTQIQKVNATDGDKLMATPVSPPACCDEVLIALYRGNASAIQRDLFVFELVSTYQKLWARGSSAVASQWKLNSLAAIIELVSSIETHTALKAATTSLVNEVADYLACERVAIGLCSNRGLRLIAISGMSDFDQNSETTRAIREALAECLLGKELTSWPDNGESSSSPTLAHRDLVRRCGFQAIVTSPLTTPDGETIGAWLFADRSANAHNGRFRSFVRTSSPRVASALCTVRRGQQGLLTRLCQAARSASRSRKALLAGAAALIVLGAMFLPVPYRIRSRCLLEPVSRRFAVAPFDGMIQKGFVEPGDVVARGTLLARMDGREVHWELSSEQALRSQAAKRRDMELTERNVPKALLAQLETERLDSRLSLLKHRADHLEIRSDIDGVILSGSLENAHSAPVKTGQVLFELGPLEELRAEIAVAAHEMDHVREGQPVKIWIDGLERYPIAGSIQRLRPRSELREGENVFVAEVAFTNVDQRFRPGMDGSARIDGPRRPLGWNLFHKPWEFLLSRLTWW